MSDFFPKPPAGNSSSSKYFKLKTDGDRFRIRILGAPLVGVEAWKDGKPVRKRTDEQWEPDEYDVDSEQKRNSPRAFWAVPIWNHSDSKIQIWNMTQVSIMNQLSDLSKSEDWGDPTKYDIVVNRDRDKKNFVTYTVTPVPPKPLPKEVLDAWDDLCAFGQFDMERMFSNGDPFGGNI